MDKHILAIAKRAVYGVFMQIVRLWQISGFSSGSMFAGNPRWKGYIYWKINTRKERTGIGDGKKKIAVYMYKNTYWLSQSLRLS